MAGDLSAFCVVGGCQAEHLLASEESFEPSANGAAEAPLGEAVSAAVEGAQ